MKTIHYMVLGLMSSCVYAHDGKQEVKLDETTSKALSRNAEAKIDARGQLTLDTNGGYRSVTLLRVNKQGKTETFCTSSEGDAKRFLEGESLDTLKGEQK